MCEAIPPLPQYVFMSWSLLKHRDKFTFLPLIDTDPKFKSKLKYYFSVIYSEHCNSLPFSLMGLPVRCHLKNGDTMGYFKA
jgi:hypothetical protein